MSAKDVISRMTENDPLLGVNQIAGDLHRLGDELFHFVGLIGQRQQPPSDVQVEELAKVLYARDAAHVIRIGWEVENDGLKGEYRGVARSILKRILPLAMTEAHQDGDDHA